MIMANPRAWTKLVDELRKCVLLCAVCHREHHAGIREIPADVTRFDERYADPDFGRNDAESLCPLCKVKKPLTATYCSRSCAAKAGGRARFVVDWNAWDVLKELETISMMALAEKIGCSHAAVWKKARKLRKQKDAG
jgi:hypothetical protein